MLVLFVVTDRDAEQFVLSNDRYNTEAIVL